MTDMDNINQLNSCRQNRKAEIIVADTQIKGELDHCLNNGKSFEKMVKSKV